MIPKLSSDQIASLTQLRHALHRAPELSGQEQHTAQKIVEALQEHAPDAVITGLGGHGVAAVYRGASEGPRVMLRCELDALPILEKTGLPYASERPQVAHLCGHDGHMAIMLGVAQCLNAHRPERGEVVLLFQPAEEDGSGARAVIADPQFASLVPDYAFSLHNMPGMPLGAVALEAGPMACASRGLKVAFTGRTAHASSPETGLSPAQAMAQVMQECAQLDQGAGPHDPLFTRVTITHAQLGAPSFGVAPAQGEVWLTLRTQHDGQMQDLVHHAETMMHTVAQDHGLEIDLSYSDVFAACTNDTAASDIFAKAVETCEFARVDGVLPMRASEDFGEFGVMSRAAMLLLGSGETHPALHDQMYDFPDQLIPMGVDLFVGVLSDLNGVAR